ncbi:hypothetical protein RD110_23590 [Rhodoferax koreense]|uniref:Uncharacterized protein n=1 Tax=Rhodoferax koreensis TaxID=1842727 RepID=A0A1P8K1C7_9BURK|nr:HupE/UreJ family protein [Rhodoferax koreense]APW39814.1 hypothetical protein RD110_23590 [Rhodoferax koreense]
MSTRSPLHLAIAAAVLALRPGRADAHGAVEGMNSFYAGLFHPFINLPQLLVLLGLGIWLGQTPPLRLKAPLLAFSLCSAAALFATTRLPAFMTPPAMLVALSLAFGLLIATAARPHRWLSTLMATAAALAVGLDSGVDGQPAPGALTLILLGTWIGTTVAVANLAYYTAICPERRWVQIGIRIAGSWLTAASVLVLAFHLRA